MTIRFAHYRALAPGPNGNPILHNKMGATVAYIEPSKEELEANPDAGIEFAVAYCHENDNFNRKLGRAIASGRLKAGKFEVAETADYKDFLYAQDLFFDAAFGLVRPGVLKSFNR